MASESRYVEPSRLSYNSQLSSAAVLPQMPMAMLVLHTRH